MVESSLQFGKVLGIHLRLHRAWIFIFAVITLLMAEQMAAKFPAWSPMRQYGWGFVASVLFFVSVLVHELGHSLAAQANGIQVHSITLHPFGGLAKLAREALKPVEEFWISLAGPVMNLFLGIVFGSASWAISGYSAALSFTFGEVRDINFLFGIFNLLPGFPLDGGRVLRAVIWWLINDYRKASLIAARIGQVLAGGLLVIGVVLLLEKHGVGLMWIGLGIYLYNAAQNGYLQAELRETLRSITVGELGWEDLPPVFGYMTLSEFLDRHDFGTRDRAFLVMDGQLIRGIISLEQAREAQTRLHFMQPSPLLSEVMQPIERFERITPQTDLVSVVEKMEFSEVSHLPVVSNNEFQGFIGRDTIMNAIRQHFEHEV